MRKIFITFLLFIFLISITSSFFAYDDSTYVWSSESALSLETSSSTEESIPVNSSAGGNFLNLESGAAILIEQSTGQVLYSSNEHEKLRPASVTKIMSLLLIMEQVDSGKLSYSDEISCSETARGMGGSQIWLDTTETLTVDEMLKAICVVSANDCVMAMAEHIAGSEQAFVQMMNDKAKELGMNDTCFKNCHGIDEDGHVTSAYDISLMSRELLSKHPDITKYTTIWMDSLRNGKSQLVNTNKLIRTYKGITGLKTGSTGLALYNLSASATRDDLSLIAVIMKAPSTKVRFAEATKLLDYGFANFAFKTFGNKDDLIKSISVDKGILQNVDAILESTAGALVEKGKENEIVQNINLPNSISAPIKTNDKLGEITFSINDTIVSSVNIVAKRAVDKINLFTMSKRIIYGWINLLRT